MNETPADIPIQDGRVDFNVVFIHSRLDDYGLSPQQFRVYAHLARRASNGTAWPSIVTISQICHLHQKTVREALHALVGYRLITRETRPGSTPFYRLTPASQWQPKQTPPHPSQTDTPGSFWEGGAPKRSQGYPSQKEPGEGNPIEGNPMKVCTHKDRSNGIPITEEEAIGQGNRAGVPTAFSIQEFNRMEAVGWVDGCHRPIKSWAHYLKQRWNSEQNQRVSQPVGVGFEKKRAGWQVEKELSEVLFKISNHPRITWPGNKDMPDNILSEFKALTTLRDKLKTEITQLHAKDS